MILPIGDYDIKTSHKAHAYREQITSILWILQIMKWEQMFIDWNDIQTISIKLLTIQKINSIRIRKSSLFYCSFKPAELVLFGRSISGVDQTKDCLLTGKSSGRESSISSRAGDVNPLAKVLLEILPPNSKDEKSSFASKGAQYCLPWPYELGDIVLARNLNSYR